MRTELSGDPSGKSSFTPDPASSVDGFLAVDDFVLPADFWLGLSASELVNGEFPPLVDDCC